MQRIRPRRRFLHAAMILLVAFGVLLQPIVGALGQLHEVEHAVVAHSDHGHSHLDGHDAPSGGGDPSGEPIGAHELLHQGGFAGSMALLHVACSFFTQKPTSESPIRYQESGPPELHLTLPFRPPIA